MGQPWPPCSPLIAGKRRRWAPFKRALPEGDQAIFDRLFDCAKLHVQAGGYASRPWAFETIMMAVVLEHEKRLRGMLDRPARRATQVLKPKMVISQNRWRAKLPRRGGVLKLC
jgi:hypothetical protein